MPLPPTVITYFERFETEIRAEFGDEIYERLITGTGGLILVTAINNWLQDKVIQ